MTAWLRREEGALSAEYIAVVPILLLLALFGWWALMLASAGNAATTAARNGARAHTMGQDCRDAVERSLPGWVDTDEHLDIHGECDEHVELSVTVPNILPVPWDPVTFRRVAHLPAMED